MKRLLQALIVSLIPIFMTVFHQEEPITVTQGIYECKSYTYVPEPINNDVTYGILTKEMSLTDEEIELVSWITIAEAEGECEEGKRLVIDTILNRIESEHYPDSAHGVIYQSGQFSSVWDGRADRVKATEEVSQLVREELKSRKNTDVIYFTAGDYGKYGTPLFPVGNHYFSSY